MEGPDPDVRALLVYARCGSGGRFAPVPTPSNVEIVLSRDPRWAGRIRGCRWTGRVLLDGSAIDDVTYDRIGVWLDRVYRLVVGPGPVERMVKMVANDCGMHPVRDWLAALVWDGTARVDTFLRDAYGVEDTPLTQEISRAFLIGAVARVVEAECKVDTVLTLVGPQGKGKSSGLRALFGAQWFSDSGIDFRNKDAMQGLRGVWVCELSELDSVHRSEISAVKAFLSSEADWFRPAYGRDFQRWPRQTIFVATTNEGAFLRDLTGSRRFWPVRIGEVDRATVVEWIAATRDQLWAEAIALYTAGERWWLSPEGEVALKEASAAFEVEQPWEAKLAAWLARPVNASGEFTLATCTEDALGLRGETQPRWAGTVVTLLERLGCRRTRPREAGQRGRAWLPPSP